MELKIYYLFWPVKTFKITFINKFENILYTKYMHTKVNLFKIKLF